MKKVAFTLAVIVMGFVAPVCDARDYPSDIDLKTAYCIRITKHLLEMLAPFASLEAMRPGIDEQSRNLARMQAYLIPKLSRIDPDPILLAAQSADKDIAAVNAIAKKCGVGMPTDASKISKSDFERAEKCTAEENRFDGGRAKRVQACNDPSWLPF